MRTETIEGNNIEFFFNKESQCELKTDFIHPTFITHVTLGAIDCIIGQPHLVIEKILSTLKNKASTRLLGHAQDIRLNGHRLIFWDSDLEFWFMTEDEYCMEDDSKTSLAIAWNLVGRSMIISPRVWDLLHGDENCDENLNFPILNDLYCMLHALIKQSPTKPILNTYINKEAVVYIDSPEHGWLSILLPEEADRCLLGYPVKYRKMVVPEFD